MKRVPAWVSKSAITALGVVVGIALAVVNRGYPAEANASLRYTLRAFIEPLSRFDARSPGERGLGSLLSTKTRAAGGPHERVLSEVRDREAPADVGDTFNPATDAPPSGLPDNIAYASTPFGPASTRNFGGFPFAPIPAAFGMAPFLASSAAPGAVRNEAPASLRPELTPGSLDLIVALSPPPAAAPPSEEALPFLSDLQPNDFAALASPYPPNTGSIPLDTTSIPEPAGWGVLLVGLGVIRSMARRRGGKRFAPPVLA